MKLKRNFSIDPTTETFAYYDHYLFILSTLLYLTSRYTISIFRKTQSMIINSEFKPAKWLKNQHGQTLYRTFTNRLQVPINFCERVELPDGDFIDLVWSTSCLNNHSPLIILLHGLGGSINSAYVASLFNAFNKSGYRAVLMNLRGANGPNRLPRFYHGGDTSDFAYVLSQLKLREPSTKSCGWNFIRW